MSLSAYWVSTSYRLHTCSKDCQVVVFAHALEEVSRERPEPAEDVDFLVGRGTEVLEVDVVFADGGRR